MKTRPLVLRFINIICRVFRGRSGLLTGFAGCGVLRGLQAPPRLQSSQDSVVELQGCGVAFRADFLVANPTCLSEMEHLGLPAC